MKTLILMRHAKSDWSAGQPDHARPLNPRGRESAAALGHWLRAEGHLPGQMLCSTAARTRETLDRLQLDAPARYEDRLYHAGPETMMSCLREAEGDTVLMVGHNPGICDFAHEIVARAPQHPRFRDYPTGATLVADFDIADWAQTEWRAAEPRAFVIPRELTEG
ncbi:SixA phosphatase family protein [Salipiger mucosus]|uniref:Phosphoglycerate mutase family protein n=1 Tax=Salipiger mucosus DSM 16094 TaxID=1123237 RepID=S9R4Q4_9RHOB|nr:histidine phosphatase family protein [Salipiger mucosus]EPX86912.1 Phosphoglycerate mutase family protein [Salipiger mucosus DSM 16094]